MKNILETMNDKQLFGTTFKRGLLGKDSWKAWRAFLAALFGLPMDDELKAIFTKCTGRQGVPTEPFTECWCIAGRRSGKSSTAALVSVYLACFRDYARFRAPGETLVLPIIAPDRKQCQIILRYVLGLIDSSPILQRMVKTRMKESVELTNGVEIRVATASYRTVRGYTAIGCVIDEAAFLRSDDSANPDSELIAAITPALATIPGALFLAISSPHARRGEVWRAFKENFGKDDARALVWRAETTAMNPSVSRTLIAAAYLRDRASATAEYGAQFRTDLENFIPIEVVEQCVVRDRRVLPPLAGVSYFGFCDPSGGRSDAMTLGISHYERDHVVLDVLVEQQAPFSPEGVVKEFAETLRRYRVFTVEGDKYAAEWVVGQFEKSGIQYRASALTRSEIYLETLPALVSGQVELLDNARLVAQLASLERHTSRGTRDSVDHGLGGHDDVSNAACGAIVLAAQQAGGVLGLIELLKLIDKHGKEVVDKMFTTSAVANPSASTMTETRPCPQCGAPMRRTKAENQNWWECEAGHAVTISPFPPQVPVTRSAYLAKEGRVGHGRGFKTTFGRFGRSGTPFR